MIVHGIAAAAPRFLTQPRDVVLEAVAAAEPNLDRRAVDRSIAEVAGTRARLRSLAKALDASPDLLNSGRPEGPRVVGLFIDSLRQHGAVNVVPPRCANCGQVRPLLRTDGPRRLCASCGGGPSKDARLPCGVCGQIRQVAGELRRRPELLTGDGALGTPRVIALVDALIEHDARVVAVPRCPFCDRVVPLKFRRDDARCCRSCYEQPRAPRCSGCGEHRPAAARTPEGEPVCTNCMRRDPMNHEPCSRCGRLARAVHRDDRGHPVCKRCWRPPLATCSTCGEHKPCHFSDTDSPRCPNCTYRMTQPPCSICGVARPVRGRTSSGDPICHPCGVIKQPCSTCGKTRIVASRTDAGPLCRTCYSANPISFRACDECGVIERLYHLGLCQRCAALRQLRSLLAGPDGTIRRELEPVYTALTASDPAALLLWLRPQHRPQELLATLAADTGPITHATLDDLGPTKAITHLRAVLVSTSVLPQRDEYLADLERWIPRRLQAVEDADERRLLRMFMNWAHLRRLRRRSAKRPLTYLQAVHAKRQLLASVNLLDWLRSQEKTLADCTQSDIDSWLAVGKTEASSTRIFVAWCVERQYAHDIEVPAYQRSDGDIDQVEPDERWGLSRRLLHDSTIPTVERVAGSLLLLYGQPVARIVAITTAQVTTSSDRGTQLILGRRPLDIPEPLGSLLLDLVNTRAGRAVVGNTADNPWLFPGGRPGRPISARQLTIRLRQLGIRPRAGRTTTLMDLAAQLPAAVLSRLLGIGIKTATNWTHAAGNTRPEYAAQLARREQLRSP